MRVGVGARVGVKVIVGVRVMVGLRDGLGDIVPAGIGLCVTIKEDAELGERVVISSISETDWELQALIVTTLTINSRALTMRTRLPFQRFYAIAPRCR